MRFAKVLAMVSVTVALIAGAFWQFFLRDQIAAAQIATAYGAKLTCSCRFVANRPMESCLSDFTVNPDPFTFIEAPDYVEVSVLAGLISSAAIHDDGVGCRLLTSED